MNRSLSSLLASAVLLAVHAPAIADSPEPPLYVEPSGSDDGHCQAETSPCQSLQYALQVVGKNGQILVGAGNYELTTVADVVYILSGAIDVQGIASDGKRPTLIGVPPDFASQLETKGFRVIVDTKGRNSAAVKSQLSLRASAAATECVGGLAGSFPCSDIDLLAHVADRTPSARGADIWGFMDLNTDREYAIVGYSSGTAVFDVSDAENPQEVGFISGQSTTWRDIKVHQFWNATENRWNAYAYITADNASDGLVILDLRNLPHRVDRVGYNSDFFSAHNVYITNTDFGTGLAITDDAPTLVLAGSNVSDGRFRAYSLANPAAPAFIAAPSTPANQPSNTRLYMHDGASMVVTDARKDTQCVNATNSDHCDVLFDFNESSVDIWDVTAPNSPVRLSRVPYSNSAYTHSGWPTEDQQYVFIQDELDERDRSLNTTLRVLDISDLTAPVVMPSWTGPTRAIDHNGFVRGNRYYMSNYSRGLTVLDITNPGNASVAGRFDTFPSGDGVGFPGNWGAYPFLPSGNIALSDIDSGFYMVADNTLDVSEGSFQFSATSFGADESSPLTLNVDRVGGSQGAVSVRWEFLGANADNDDVSVTGGVLNWADGDNGSRTISIALVNDGNAEMLERAFVKLLAPTGGATLSAPAISAVHISDPGNTPEVGFSTASLTVTERGFGTAVATVQRAGSAVGALSVDFSIVAGDATAGADYNGASTGTVSWADGDANPKSIEYTISDDGSGESAEFFDLQLSNVAGGAITGNSLLRINILDGTGSNNAPNSVAGASQTVSSGSTVTLSGTGSNDPDGDTLTYAWTQTQGPNVTLSNANTAVASFTAPSVTSDTLLRFDLTVSDASGLSDASTANVTVSSTSSGGSVSGGGGGGPIDVWSLMMLAGLWRLSRKDVS